MAEAAPPVQHSSAFRTRRFLNWFPLGITYALLYMGRYNLTVAKTSLSQKLMTKEDFGIIFATGTIVYAFAFLFNGPLVDRIGGRRGALIAAAGTMVANLAMGFYLQHVLSHPDSTGSLRIAFSFLYAFNMYFQSFGAVSILKVNVNWFHVRERGGFSGIFGTMIASGIFLAFTVNGMLLKANLVPGFQEPVIFFAPAALLFIFFIIEYFLLRDRPSDAGQADFDTGDASSGDTSTEPLKPMELYKKLLSSPIVLTVAAIELCTGVVRQGVMQWFPIYVGEVWAMPATHYLGPVGAINWWYVLFGAIAAVVLGGLGSIVKGQQRAGLVVGAGLCFMGPFILGGWGGILFVAGVLGGNLAGWVSDLFFQSRRGPAAAGLYLFMGIITLSMSFLLAPPTSTVETADATSGLVAGDKIVKIADKPIEGWADVRVAVACWEATCKDSGWDEKECTCTTKIAPKPPLDRKTIPAVILREGKEVAVDLPDPKATQRAGENRLLKAKPVLPLNPYFMGFAVFLISLCVIGTHGLLSGTATIDFGGRKAAATAGGLIDGCVYLGTAIQGLSLGFLTTKSWSYWPPFLVPFAIIGFLLCLRIWNAKPSGKGGH
jgi:sugar phosphate permease